MIRFKDWTIKNKKHIIVLTILCILIILPAFVAENKYPFSYPVNDFQNDVNRAEQAKIDGDINDISNHYLGRTIMAYTIGKVSLVTGIDCYDLQLWINYVMLLLASFCVYVVVYKLFGLTAGIMSVLITFFCTHGFLILFSSGDIWEIIEIGIVLIPALYFLVKWTVNKRPSCLVCLLVLLAVFSSVHPLALILPYIMSLFFGCYIIYKLSKREYKEAGVMAILLIGIIIINLTLSYFFIKDAIDLHLALFGKITGEVSKNTIMMYGIRTPIGIFTLLYQYITLPVIGILCVAIVLMAKRKGNNTGIELIQESKLFILLLGSFVIPFLLASATKYNIDTIRHAMDAGTLIAIITGCLIGVVIEKYKSKILYAITTSTIALGIIPTLLIWFSTQGK